MPRPGYISVRVAEHERKLMRSDADHYDVGLSQYLVLMWRNMHSLGLPLRVLPPFPVDPYDPSKKS